MDQPRSVTRVKMLVLTVDLEVEKIDDNGFVTLKLDPTIAVPVSAGVQEGVAISDINEREH